MTMIRIALAWLLLGSTAFAAASFADQVVLSGDPVFQGRVRQALVATCVSISNEAWSTAFHRERQTFCSLVINAPDSYKPLFTNSVSTDATVIADATQGGTVVLTSGNVAVQAALVTDAHINTAIAAEFNTYFRTPGS